MVKLLGRLMVALVFVPGVILTTAHSGLAACHAFTVSINPATVAEGGSVAVTVARDAEVGPSSVQVTSVDETATSGADYDKVDRRIEFSTERQQTFSVDTRDDSSQEGTETFLLRVSNGAGCINPNFRYGPDARVTIQASDSAPTGGSSGPSKTSPAKSSPTPSRSTAVSASPSPQESIAMIESPSPSPELPPPLSPTSLAESAGARGGSPGWIITAALVLLIVGTGTAWWLWRGRSA